MASFSPGLAALAAFPASLDCGVQSLAPSRFPSINPNAIFPGSTDCVQNTEVGAIGVQTGSGGSSSLAYGNANQGLCSGGSSTTNNAWCTFPLYVLGTWTPVITTDATVGTPAYTTQLGTYEQIGRQITARFNIQLSGWTGSPTGNVKINGLPVANVGNYGTCTVSFYSAVNLANSASGISGIIADTASAIDLYSMQNTSTIKLTAAALTTVGGVVGWCSYHN